MRPLDDGISSSSRNNFKIKARNGFVLCDYLLYTAAEKDAFADKVEGKRREKGGGGEMREKGGGGKRREKGGGGKRREKGGGGRERG